MVEGPSQAPAGCGGRKDYGLEPSYLKRKLLLNYLT
jgi:hypothetical protein